jgi:hypothetical protein
MSALRRVTAPPIELAEAVTNSLREDVLRNSNILRILDASRKTVGFFNGPPRIHRGGCDGVLTQRIFTAISPSSPILSGIPL